MEISGVVMAKNDGHAYKILEGLQKEYILDYFDVGREIDAGNPHSLDYLEVFIDSEGYITFEEDFSGGRCIKDIIPYLPGYKLFRFTAEYGVD